MGWKEERDLLIAQTMAFVQSVAGKQPDTELGVAARPNLATEPAVESAPVEAVKLRAAEVVTPPPAALHNEIQANIQIPRTAIPTDVRAEIQARVANFRAHQQRFSREREEYFSATLTKARSAIENDSTPDPSDRTPPRR
jgi:hypothetical protein